MMSHGVSTPPHVYPFRRHSPPTSNPPHVASPTHHSHHSGASPPADTTHRPRLNWLGGRRAAFRAASTSHRHHTGPRTTHPAYLPSNVALSRPMDTGRCCRRTRLRRIPTNTALDRSMPTLLPAFDATINGAGDSLVIIDFSTTWCGPCKE